jgi:hypothetical protein
MASFQDLIVRFTLHERVGHLAGQDVSELGFFSLWLLEDRGWWDSSDVNRWIGSALKLYVIVCDVECKRAGVVVEVTPKVSLLNSERYT